MDISVNRFFEEQEEYISQVVTSHLLIEGILERLLVRTLANPSALDLERMMFARKLSMVRALGLVDDPSFQVLRKMNRLRNKFAHQLGFVPTFEEVHDVVAAAGSAGVDFSDDVDRDVKHARSLNYDVPSLLEALFRNVFISLAMTQGQDFWDEILA